MKKFIFCAMLVFAVTVTYSQITITSQQVPAPGTTIVMSIDDSPTGVNPGTPGPGQTWDFTALSEDETETLKYYHPSSTPFPNYFPDANLALTADDTIYSYMHVDDASWVIQGAAGQTEGVIFSFDIVPDAIMANFPFNYGDQFSQDYSYNWYLAFGEDSARFKSSVSTTVDVDAWGTVSIVTGTYDALRVKTEETHIDSTWFKFGGTWVLKDASTTFNNYYGWYTNHPSVGLELVTIYYDENWENPDEADFFKDSFVGIGQPDKQAGIKVYPSPASNYLTVETTNAFAGKFRVFELSGKLILEEEISQGNNKINVSALRTGIYTYSFIGDDRGSIQSGHFTVVR